MSTQLIGGILGGVLGLVNFFLLKNVSENIARNSEDGENSRAATFITWAAWADLVIFPLIGYYLGGIFA